MFSEFLVFLQHVRVSKNGGTPKSSILVGFSLINPPFWDIPIYGNTHVRLAVYLKTVRVRRAPENLPAGNRSREEEEEVLVVLPRVWAAS